jgi:hypothetical protein
MCCAYPRPFSNQRLSEHDAERVLSSVAIRTLSAEPTPRLASAPPTSRDLGPKPGKAVAAASLAATIIVAHKERRFVGLISISAVSNLTGF